jgi:diacylglycerol kinase family enzyme
VSRRSARNGAARAAAWVALAAAAALVATLGVVAFRSLVAILLVLACFAVLVGAAWIAATRRGVKHGLGLVGVLGAFGGILAVLAVYDLFGALAAVAASCIVFAVSSRRAFAASSTPGPPTYDVTARPATPSRRRPRAILLMNPRSGGGKVKQFNLVEEAQFRGIEPIVLRPGDDLRRLAEDAASRAAVIGMAGGDGSQALVAEVAIAHGLPFACIPAGTRNHLALDLGLDVHDVVSALDAFADGVETAVDIAYVNDRIFVNNVSLGVYAQIVQSDAYRGAKRETIQEMLPDLLGPDSTPFDLHFLGPDGEERRTADVLLVSNNPYELHKLGSVGGRARIDGGRLGIVALTIRSPADAAKLMALDAVGQLSHFEGWLEWEAEEFDVSAAGLIAAGIDGESISLPSPLHFRSVPGALRLLLPPNAAHRVSTLPLSGSALRELWHIGTGSR